MADRVAVLRDGRIAQYAAPQGLYTRSADPALARFAGDANLLQGRLAAGNPGREPNADRQRRDACPGERRGASA